MVLATARQSGNLIEAAASAIDDLYVVARLAEYQRQQDENEGEVVDKDFAHMLIGVRLKALQDEAAQLAETVRRVGAGAAFNPQDRKEQAAI